MIVLMRIAAFALLGAGILHIIIGARIFSPDRSAARRAPDEHFFSGPPSSEAGRYSTLVGSFQALGVNWIAIACLLFVVAAHPTDAMARPLLVILVLWSIGNLFCAVRWVTWNRTAQAIFAAVGLTSFAALLVW
jgi:hypothetical protein